MKNKTDNTVENEMLERRLKEELKQIKLHISCIELYTDKTRSSNWYCNAIIVMISSLSAFSALQGYYKITIVASVATVIGTALKSIFDGLIQPEKDIEELDKLYVFYTKMFNSLEILWFDFVNKKKGYSEIENMFFQLKEEECGKSATLNKLMKKIPLKMQEEAIAAMQGYLDSVYKIK